MNLIEDVAPDRAPIPRFWYLPFGKKAAVVMTGDDHALGGTAGRFDRYLALSPAGCSVVDWECVRATSYIYPVSPLTAAQAARVHGPGLRGRRPPVEQLPKLDARLARDRLHAAAEHLRLEVPGRAGPRLEPDALRRVERLGLGAEDRARFGIRLDTNYYHYPGAWIGSKPGFMTGSGIPMRFADLDGSLIDVFQAATQMTDESGQAYPATADALLDKALGPEGYYGIFTANMHTDHADHAGSDAIVAAAQARSVPIISAQAAARPGSTGARPPRSRRSRGTRAR